MVNTWTPWLVPDGLYWVLLFGGVLSDHEEGLKVDPMKEDAKPQGRLPASSGALGRGEDEGKPATTWKPL